MRSLDQFRSELQAQIEAVRGEIRPSIRSELDHESERLKLTIGTAWKVLGVAIAVVVGAAAYFSIKTAYDVDKGIEAAANREVAHKLADDNVKSPFKRVLTKALVDSYLVRLARFESDQKKSPFQFPQSVDLDAVAADQLTTSLKDPTTTEEDFKKVVEVLVRTRPYDNPTTSSRSTSSPVSRQLGNLVKGASPDFGWVLNEPSRRSFVLKRLVRSYDVDLISASKIILKDESDTGLLVAAAQYLEANGDRDSAQVLENAFKRRTDDPDVSKACLIAVARLQPRSPVVQKHLDDLVAGRSEKLKLLEAPTLAAEFLKDTPLFERQTLPGMEEVEQDREERQNLAQRLIQTSFEKGLKFTYYGESSFQQGLYSSLPGLQVISSVDASLFTGKHGQELMARMLKEGAIKGFKPFSDLVEKLSVRKEDIFSPATRSADFAVRVHVVPSGQFLITTVDGRSSP